MNLHAHNLVIILYDMTDNSKPKAPKSWKFAFLVWCFIYPAITVLNLTLGPYVAAFPLAVKTLIMSLILVPLMAWMYIPFINNRFYHWMRR
ncbi:MAG: hypothetical protein ACO28K_00630 [Bacteroidia bacterium]|nr:hypothetical protein [Bacteroidia bacterium]NBY09524.1 hypothetical protein [Sphingobacteriia bacterium]